MLNHQQSCSKTSGQTSVYGMMNKKNKKPPREKWDKYNKSMAKLFCDYPQFSFLGMEGFHNAIVNLHQTHDYDLKTYNFSIERHRIKNEAKVLAQNNSKILIKKAQQVISAENEEGCFITDFSTLKNTSKSPIGNVCFRKLSRNFCFKKFLILYTDLTRVPSKNNSFVYNYLYDLLPIQSVF